MNHRPMNNEKGFTLIEMLIAMSISVILLGAAMYTYTKQDQVLRDENMNLKLRDYARLAMDQLDDNLHMAGYGFPAGDSAAGRPAQAIDVADATILTYKANTGNISTRADQNSTATTNNWVWAADPVAAGFAVDDNVVFFNVRDPSQWNAYPIAGVNTTTIVWTGGNQNGFDVQPTLGVPVLVNKYHTITYNYNAGGQIITVTDDNGTDDGGGDDTTTTIATNVSNLTLSYFDADGNPLTTLPLSAADRGEVRKIQISLTVVDEIESSMTAILQTNVHLRNMGS